MGKAERIREKQLRHWRKERVERVKATGQQLIRTRRYDEI